MSNKQFLDYNGLSLYTDKMLSMLGTSDGSSGSNTPADLEKAPLFSITSSLSNLETETDGKWIMANGRDLNPDEYPDLLDEVGFPYGRMWWNKTTGQSNNTGSINSALSFAAFLSDPDDEAKHYSLMSGITSENSKNVYYLMTQTIVDDDSGSFGGQSSYYRVDTNWTYFTVFGAWIKNSKMYCAVRGKVNQYDLHIIEWDSELGTFTIIKTIPGVSSGKLSNPVQRNGVTYIGGYLNFSEENAYAPVIISHSNEDVTITCPKGKIPYPGYVVLRPNYQFILGDYFYYTIQESPGSFSSYKTNILTLETSIEDSEALKPFMDASKDALNSSIAGKDKNFAKYYWFAKDGNSFLYLHWTGTEYHPKAYTIYLVKAPNGVPIVDSFSNIVPDTRNGGDDLKSQFGVVPEITGLFRIGSKNDLYVSNIIRTQWNLSKTERRGMLAKLNNNKNHFQYQFEIGGNGNYVDTYLPDINTSSYNYVAFLSKNDGSISIAKYLNKPTAIRIPDFTTMMFGGHIGIQVQYYYIKVRK